MPFGMHVPDYPNLVCSRLLLNDSGMIDSVGSLSHFWQNQIELTISLQ